MGPRPGAEGVHGRNVGSHLSPWPRYRVGLPYGTTILAWVSVGSTQEVLACHRSFQQGHHSRM